MPKMLPRLESEYDPNESGGGGGVQGVEWGADDCIADTAQ